MYAGGQESAPIAATSTPAVSVVVPTRNRPEHVSACATAILSTAGFRELVVVDQSDDDVTAQVLSSIKDPRFRCVRTATRGVTNGRNLGIALTNGDIIAFTDDDCRVSGEWVFTMIPILG